MNYQFVEGTHTHTYTRITNCKRTQRNIIMASSERENELCSENCGKCEKLDLTWHSLFGLTMHVHTHTHSHGTHIHIHVCGALVATCVSRFQLFFFIQDLGLCVSHIFFAASHSLSLALLLLIRAPFFLFLCPLPLPHSFPLSLIFIVLPSIQ